MVKIEFSRPNPRIEDWCVKWNGHSVGSVWRAGADYLVSVSHEERATTLDSAFKAARKQVKGLTAA